MELKRVGPWAVARVFETIYAALGLIFGALFACIALLGGTIAPRNGDDGAAFGALFGAGAIVLLSVFCGVLGVVFGALSAWLYNVFAGMVGGIEVQFEPPQGPTAP
jgi:Transmembrane domain of unknown function (DUF3566)